MVQTTKIVETEHVYIALVVDTNGTKNLDIRYDVLKGRDKSNFAFSTMYEIDAHPINKIDSTSRFGEKVIEYGSGDREIVLPNRFGVGIKCAPKLRMHLCLNYTTGDVRFNVVHVDTPYQYGYKFFTRKQSEKLFKLFEV